MPDVDVPHYSADDMARIQTNCIQLDNELQRQQQLWQAAHDVRREVLPQVKEIMQVLQRQAQIAATLEQEIAALGTAKADAQAAHDQAVAGLRHSLEQANAVHQAALAEFARQEAALATQRTQLQQHADEWMRQTQAEMQQLRGEHAVALTDAQREHALALAALEHDRDRAQAQILELQSLRDDLTRKLQGQLTALKGD